MLIQASLLISGITTLIQLFPPIRAMGSKLPIIMGVSFAYIPILTTLGLQYDLATILGAQLVGGLVVVLVGIFYKKVMHFFPTIVTGTVVFSIGLPCIRLQSIIWQAVWVRPILAVRRTGR